MLFKELLKVFDTTESHSIRIDIYDADTDTQIKYIYKMNEIPKIYNNLKVCIIYPSNDIYESDPYQYFVSLYK